MGTGFFFKEKVNYFEPQECMGLLQREQGWHSLRGWKKHPPELEWKGGCYAGGDLDRHFYARKRQQEEIWRWVLWVLLYLEAD